MVNHMTHLEPLARARTIDGEWRVLELAKIFLGVLVDDALLRYLLNGRLDTNHAAEVAPLDCIAGGCASP